MTRDELIERLREEASRREADAERLAAQAGQPVTCDLLLTACGAAEVARFDAGLMRAAARELSAGRSSNFFRLGFDDNGL